jgi:2'-5' RNA ligase
MMSYADYLMIISLPDALIKEINRYKRASVNAIGHFEGMHNRAYITVTHQVRCKPFLAQPAIARMDKRLSTMPPIKLHIKGFGYFSHGNTARTIYAIIETTERTNNWFKLLTMQMGIKVKDFVPHIPIARNIPITAFNKLWPNFVNREFIETFKVDGLTILHKDTFAEHGEWTVYRELTFGNKLLAF